MKIDTAIQNEKKKLIDKVKKKGIYENFGQKEVRKLEDKFINTSSYTDEMNYIRKAIQEFDKWCMDYS